MTTKIEGIVGDQRGTLIKYNEVFKKLKVPSEYIVDDMLIWDVFVTFFLTKVEELKLGKITSRIRKFSEEYSRIELTKDDFKKKLGLKYEHFDIEPVFKEKTALLRIRGSRELLYYLGKNSEQVYFWISEEKVDEWKKKNFVETK